MTESSSYTPPRVWKWESANVRMVNRLRGELHEQLHERHDATDFTTKTQDKMEAAS